MKVLALVFALAVFGAHAAPADDDVDVAGDVEKAIKAILDAIDEPVFDIKDASYTLDLTIEKVVATIDELLLGGIKAAEIQSLTYDASTSRLDYSFNLAEVDAIIDLDLLLSGLLALDHHPIANIILDNLKIAGYAVIDTVSEPNKVTDLQVLITLEKAKVDTSGLFNDEDFSKELSDILTEQLPTIVNDVAAALEPVIDSVAKALINLILKLR